MAPTTKQIIARRNVGDDHVVKPARREQVVDGPLESDAWCRSGISADTIACLVELCPDWASAVGCCGGDVYDDCREDLRLMNTDGKGMNAWCALGPL